ncbi:hypothetical protein D5086_014781 [Populus alba]|uniref:Uncharacterized protein n=1 Tax=Populus alba TaxID=43335 RepID=A0ACC4BZ71_POPAL
MISSTENLGWGKIPGSPSVIGGTKPTLDGCPGFDKRCSQQPFFMVSPQPALSSSLFSLAGGVSEHFFGISGQTIPSHVSTSTCITPSPVGEDYTRVSYLHGNISSHALPPVCFMHHLDICPLLPEDFGDDKDIWKMCLIGYSIGRIPGCTILGKYMANDTKQRYVFCYWSCTGNLEVFAALL